jgi:hypothetical protein
LVSTGQPVSNQVALERLARCGKGYLELSWSSACDGLGVLAAPGDWAQVAAVAEALPQWSDLASWLRAAWDQGRCEFLRIDLAENRIAAITAYGRTREGHPVLTFPFFGSGRRLRPDGREARAVYYDVRHLPSAEIADDLAERVGALDFAFDRALFLAFAECGWLQFIALHADSTPSFTIASPDRHRLAALIARLDIDPAHLDHVRARGMLGYAAIRFGRTPVLRCYARPQRFSMPGAMLAGPARC